MTSSDHTCTCGAQVPAEAFRGSHRVDCPECGETLCASREEAAMAACLMLQEMCDAEPRGAFPYPRLDPRILTAEKLPHDADSRVPEYLDQVVGIALSHDSLVASSPTGRAEREHARTAAVKLATDYLIDKYRNHARTTQLFQDVIAGRRDFALYLREFPLKRKRTAYGTMSSGTFGEVVRRRKIAAELPEIPILWSPDPLYDVWPEKSSLGDAPDTMYRVELDEHWKSHMTEIVRSARVILVDGDPASKGLAYEVQFITDHGRQEVTFFTQAKDSTGPFTPYDKRGVLDLWHSGAPRAVNPVFPPATVPWIRGELRRSTVASIATHYEALAEKLDRAYSEVNLKIDLMLHSHLSVMLYSLLLEDVNAFGRFTVQLARFIAKASPEELPNAQALASFYYDLARPRGFPRPPEFDLSPNPDKLHSNMLQWFSGPEFGLEPGSDPRWLAPQTMSPVEEYEQSVDESRDQYAPSPEYEAADGSYTSSFERQAFINEIGESLNKAASSVADDLLDEAIKIYEAVLAKLTSAGEVEGVDYVFEQIIELHQRLLQHRTAAKFLLKWEKHCVVTDNHEMRLHVVLQCAMVQLTAGEADGALETLNTAEEICKDHGYEGIDVIPILRRIVADLWTNFEFASKLLHDAGAEYRSHGDERWIRTWLRMHAEILHCRARSVFAVRGPRAGISLLKKEEALRQSIGDEQGILRSRMVQDAYAQRTIGGRVRSLLWPKPKKS